MVTAVVSNIGDICSFCVCPLGYECVPGYRQCTGCLHTNSLCALIVAQLNAFPDILRWCLTEQVCLEVMGQVPGSLNSPKDSTLLYKNLSFSHSVWLFGESVLHCISDIFI